MKESYREGVANHPDPESCEGGRKAALEALTGAQIGRVIELRNLAVEGADAVRRAEGNTVGDDSASPLLALAEAALRRTGVEEPGHVWKPGALWARENRETPSASVALGGGPVGEGDELYVQYARWRGVERLHSTCEVSEQGRETVGGGHGGKAAGQGERPAATSSWTRSQVGRACWLPGVRCDCCLVAHALYPRWEPCAVVPRARVCAGGSG